MVRMVKQTIQIFARIKPTNKTTAVYSVDNEEQSGGSLEFILPRDLADGFINNKRESYRFRFQKVFDQTTNQEGIFEAIAKPVADTVLAGYNGTIFAYGQTGSGKTFTITGGPERYSDRGIIPRTLSYLYQHFSRDSSMVYTTHISYLEIYNEVGYDLLDPRHEASNLEDLPKVTIMEDPEQNIHLKNLSLQPSANEEDALNLLFLGDTNRMIAETPMNQASTRSHCIFTIHLCSREPGSATLRRSKLHLVDLAGSERVGKTGVGGQTLTEAKYINLSLHYLEQVITALSEKNRSHIPYRNSMMTSVLRDSLGGNCMTTMIAMVSVDKRNVDESISTCRFAQRVAMIKNEALLNEELDPSLLIIRLKKEIQGLKEELAMVTGEQRSDDLTQEEIQRIENQLKVFLDDPDPEVTLELGPDMRKIQHCFSFLKARLREEPSTQKGSDDISPLPSSSITDRPDSQANRELLKLKDMLTQRDNEISILVSMLKKEKRKVQEANAQLAKFSGSQSSLQSSSSSMHAEKTLKREASQDSIHAEHVKCKQNEAELSMGRQEAFEIFRSEHEDNITIEDNKVILKQRFAEAKELGEQVNQARSRVNELKKQLETRRMQMAAQGVIGNQPNTESDPVEERLRNQIEDEKKHYKSTFERLKGLKTEIEHLQHLLQKSKIKLQKDFQDWWNQEAARLQQSQCSENTRAGRSQDNSPCPPSSSSRHDHHINNQDRARQPTPPTRELRALSSAGLASTSIPLTGDQQTDADILAFIKARHNLLSRTGNLIHTLTKLELKWKDCLIFTASFIIQFSNSPMNCHMIHKGQDIFPESSI
ncbi:kinesin-like protein KIF6 isoform X1 [Pangasianodon hypophthalmus]|uniref:kinesin-like protein KIF6 isoform X1 n=1 Tax=Pangasianodon hypophthalmus TaxID=310915 RepID=UPI002306ECD0|nr:kinesin-like protein KIF6 isoform X1 [Pangasianodon hypophthalmus]